MKFKPKEVMVNLPTVLTFSDEEEIIQMAAAFNTFIHGKVKMKYEVLGKLGGQHVGLFYIQRNSESQQLRDEWVQAINAEEQLIWNSSHPPSTKKDGDGEGDWKDEEENNYDSFSNLTRDQDGRFSR
jgi:hypothetical protein